MREYLIEIALRELNHLIANEMEYPDAFYKISTNLDLTTREKHALIKAYDEQGIRV